MVKIVKSFFKKKNGASSAEKKGQMTKDELARMDAESMSLRSFGPCNSSTQLPSKARTWKKSHWLCGASSEINVAYVEDEQNTQKQVGEPGKQADCEGTTEEESFRSRANALGDASTNEERHRRISSDSSVHPPILQTSYREDGSDDFLDQTTTSSASPSIPTLSSRNSEDTFSDTSSDVVPSPYVMHDNSSVKQLKEALDREAIELPQEYYENIWELFYGQSRNHLPIRAMLMQLGSKHVEKLYREHLDYRNNMGLSGLPKWEYVWPTAFARMRDEITNIITGLDGEDILPQILRQVGEHPRSHGYMNATYKVLVRPSNQGRAATSQLLPIRAPKARRSFRIHKAIVENLNAQAADIVEKQELAIQRALQIQVEEEIIARARAWKVKDPSWQ